MHFALHDLSNGLSPSAKAIEMNVPEPMEAKDGEANFYYPWLSFINR